MYKTTFIFNAAALYTKLLVAFVIIDLYLRKVSSNMNAISGQILSNNKSINK